MRRAAQAKHVTEISREAEPSAMSLLFVVLNDSADAPDAMSEGPCFLKVLWSLQVHVKHFSMERHGRQEPTDRDCVCHSVHVSFLHTHEYFTVAVQSLSRARRKSC